jgi:hypothetical protein
VDGGTDVWTEVWTGVTGGRSVGRRKECKRWGRSIGIGAEVRTVGLECRKEANMQAGSRRLDGRTGVVRGQECWGNICLNKSWRLEYTST